MSYQILHKPTGLFYCPSRKVKNRAGAYVKSNLSKKGKIYNISPALGWIGGSIYTHLHNGMSNERIDVPSSDWEIIEEGVMPIVVATDQEAIRLAFDAMVAHMQEKLNKPPPVNFLHIYESAFKVAVNKLDSVREGFNLRGAL
jgi:hypothetical protein